MRAITATSTAILASMLVLSGPAIAQSDNAESDRNQVERLDRESVRDWIRSMQRDISRAVESGNHQELLQWTRENVSDDAVFSGLNTISMQGQPKINISAQLTKQDLVGMQRFALSSMHDMSNNMQNYSLRIRVTDVEPIGDRAAVVKTRITESGSMGGGQARIGGMSEEGEQLQGFQEQQGQTQRVSFESQSTCTHLLTLPESGGQIELGVTNCAAETNIAGAGGQTDQENSDNEQ